MSMQVGSTSHLNEPNNSWWSTQTTKVKVLLIACGITSTLTLVFIICTIALARKGSDASTRPAAKDGSTGEYCSSRVCIQTASDMKNRMNEDLNPCDNFYSFACERFESTQRELGGMLQLTGEEMVKDLQDILKTYDPEAQENTALKSALYFYQKCKAQGSDEVKAVQAVRNLVEEILGTSWPFAVGSKWDESNFDWSQSLARLFRLGEVLGLGIMIIPDVTDPKKLSLNLVPVPSLPSRQPVNLTELVCTVYTDCSLNVTLDPALNQGTYSVPGINIMKTEEQLPVLPESSADQLRVLSKYTIKEFQTEVPQVDWKLFFQTLFDGSEIKITETFTFISNASIVRTFVDKFQSNKRVIANTIGLLLVQKYGQYVSSSIRSSWPSPQPLDTICYDAVNKLYEFSLGKMYKEKYMPADSLTKVKELASEIQEGFKIILKNSPWLDENTRNLALKKVENMEISVGSPSWVWNNEDLAAYYKDALLTKESPFEEAVIRAKRNKVNQLGMQLNKPLNRTNLWLQSTTVTNAFYMALTNTMYYPLGILRSPYYVPGRSRTINLGTLGYVAGHELTHGFDWNGKDFDENGNIKDWWDPDTKKEFETGARCFVKQYGDIIDELSGLKINGTQTLSENIADNGGLKAAYQAYKNSPTDKIGKLVGFEKYSQDQLFFISAAQIWCAKATKETMRVVIGIENHSPDKYRALLPFQNFPEFSKAFGCELGKTKMNPKEKCTIW